MWKPLTSPTSLNSHTLQPKCHCPHITKGETEAKVPQGGSAARKTPSEDLNLLAVLQLRHTHGRRFPGTTGTTSRGIIPRAGKPTSAQTQSGLQLPRQQAPRGRRSRRGLLLSSWDSRAFRSFLIHLLISWAPLPLPAAGHTGCQASGRKLTMYG